MRILLTGASGMLGSAITSVGHKKGFVCDPLLRDRIDNRRFSELVDVLSQYDAIIHAAANTNVEACEETPSVCYRDNTFMTETLARAAHDAGIRFIFISSTGVYGQHSDKPYHEYDQTIPTTHYHRSKLLGEVAASRSTKSLIVRTGWLFGGAPANPKNFVARRMEEAARCKTEMFSNETQMGCPTYADDVAGRIFDLICAGCCGVYNCVNSGVASRYDYVSEIIRLSGFDISLKPAPAATFPRKASVSNNEMAVNLKQELDGMAAMRTWRDALKEYISVYMSAES